VKLEALRVVMDVGIGRKWIGIILVDRPFLPSHSYFCFCQADRNNVGDDRRLQGDVAERFGTKAGEIVVVQRREYLFGIDIAVQQINDLIKAEDSDEARLNSTPRNCLASRSA
jgi:hypothetical protein